MDKQEAIKILKEFHDTSALFSVRTALETVFPELKEDEDELEWLKQFIQEEAYSLSMDIRDDEDRIKLKKLQRSLAWLKKQDNNLVKNGYTDNKDIIKYADNYSHEIWHKLMDNFKNIKDYHIGCNDVSDIVLNAIIDAYNWLEKQGEQEPIEWKDSDEKYLFWALLSIQKDIAASEINGVNTKDLNDCVRWLYSLKQRIGG